MKLDIFKNINNSFYVDKLYLANNDSFSSQPINDLQPPSIQKDNIEKFIIKDIIAETIIKMKKK